MSDRVRRAIAQHYVEKGQALLAAAEGTTKAVDRTEGFRAALGAFDRAATALPESKEIAQGRDQLKLAMDTDRRRVEPDAASAAGSFSPARHPPPPQSQPGGRFVVKLCPVCGSEEEHRWVGGDLSCDRCYRSERRIPDEVVGRGRFVQAQCRTGCECMTQHRWVGDRLSCDECFRADQEGRGDVIHVDLDEQDGDADDDSPLGDYFPGNDDWEPR